jgi:septum site-determining protein MinC
VKTETTSKSFHINGNMQTILMLEITEVNQNINAELASHFNQAPKLFKNQPLIISIDQVNFQINGDYLKLITSTCSDASVNVIGVSGCHSLVAQEAVKAAGLSEISPKKSSEKKPETPQNVSKPQPSQNPAETIRYGHVRSGQMIEAPGTLIVIGNISRGAEIIAGGSIHVYGSLNGRAIAGSYGNTNATIIAQAFDPELVCIAGVYTTSEQTHFSSPELSIAKLENHAIEVTQI